MEFSSPPRRAREIFQRKRPAAPAEAISRRKLMSTKKSASKARAKKPAVKKAPVKKSAAAPVKKAVTKAKTKVTKTMEPKPKATNPPQKDVGIFGVIQKNIQEGISVITETILPTPKRASRKR